MPSVKTSSHRRNSSKFANKDNSILQLFSQHVSFDSIHKFSHSQRPKYCFHLSSASRDGENQSASVHENSIIFFSQFDFMSTKFTKCIQFTNQLRFNVYFQSILEKSSHTKFRRKKNEKKKNDKREKRHNRTRTKQILL